MRSLAFAALLLAFSASAPGQAGIVGRYDRGYEPSSNPFLGDSRLPGPGIGRDLDGARIDIRHAREGGLITRAEARRMNREARLIGELARRYARDGLSEAERRELEIRTQRLRETASGPAPAAR